MFKNILAKESKIVVLTVALVATVTGGQYSVEAESITSDNKFENSQKTAPDNTAKNQRDIKLGRPTPLNQSNGKKDVEITRQLRRSIMETKGLSLNGQNIKIITRKGRVTLRGPVQSENEKNLIEDLVKNSGYVTAYVNQLEVKKNK